MNKHITYKNTQHLEDKLAIPNIDVQLLLSRRMIDIKTLKRVDEYTPNAVSSVVIELQFGECKQEIFLTDSDIAKLITSNGSVFPYAVVSRHHDHFLMRQTTSHIEVDKPTLYDKKEQLKHIYEQVSKRDDIEDFVMYSNGLGTRQSGEKHIVVVRKNPKWIDGVSIEDVPSNFAEQLDLFQNGGIDVE